MDGSPSWRKGSSFVPAGTIKRFDPPTLSDDTPSANPLTFLQDAFGSAPAAAPAVVASPVQNVTIQPSSDPSSWNYVLQHGNSQYEAVILDGAQMFRNKRTGQFKSSMRGLGLGALPEIGGVNIFVAAGLGYVLYRLMRKKR